MCCRVTVGSFVLISANGIFINLFHKWPTVQPYCSDCFTKLYPFPNVLRLPSVVRFDGVF